MSQSAIEGWALFGAPALWERCDKAHIRALLDRVTMTSGEQHEGPERNGRMADLAREWGPRMLMSAASALLAVGIFYGISTEKWDKFEKADARQMQLIRQNNEGMLANRVAIQEAAIARAKEIAGLRISLGRSFNKALKPVAANNANQNIQLARLTEVLERFEAEMRRALERIRDQRNTP